MLRQVGAPQYDSEGMLIRGLVVRHLVLPSNRADSIAVLQRLASLMPKNEFLISIMSQYTPDFAFDSGYKELSRRVTAFEYDSVVAEADRLGLSGFIQRRDSASAVYTPKFDL